MKNRIKLLIEILEKSNINKLEVSSFWGFRKIKLFQDNSNLAKSEIKKNDTVKPLKEEILKGVNLQNIDSIEESEAENKIETESLENIEHIKAPLVGTIYLSSKPDEPTFINENDVVKKGQVVCVIEAMKIFNDIEADRDGVIKSILVENEDPVEFGQPLFEIVPSNQ